MKTITRIGQQTEDVKYPVIQSFALLSAEFVFTKLHFYGNALQPYLFRFTVQVFIMMNFVVLWSTVKSCAELYKSGNTLRGVYTIDPHSSGAFDMFDSVIKQ